MQHSLTKFLKPTEVSLFLKCKCITLSRKIAKFETSFNSSKVIVTKVMFQKL